MDSGISYGRWLRSKRGRKGTPGFLSQEALAERVGVQRTYINQIENGRVGVPDPPLRERIHAALGTTEEELIALGIVSRPSRPSAVRRVLNEVGPTRSDADRFIASLTPEQRALLRRLLDEGDVPRPGDEDPAAEARRLRDAG